MEDIKTILIDILSRNMAVTKDDGVTPAVIQTMTKWYDDETMSNVDAIVTVGTIDDTVTWSGDGDPNSDFTHVAEVNVWAASKFDSTGAQVITDDVMRWKLCQEISRVIAANASLPKYSPSSLANPQPSDYPAHYNALVDSGIKDMRVRVFRDLDDPQHTPYPLRRSQFEVEIFFQRQSLAV